MILVDANLLIYSRLSTFAEHARARAWLDDRLNGRAGVGLPWASLLAFLRVSTNHRMFPHPLPMDAAWKQVRDWLDLPASWSPGPTAGHTDILDRLIVGRGLTSKLVMDAHLAALAIEHGLILCSADDDFRRFAGLRFENPLHD